MDLNKTRRKALLKQQTNELLEAETQEEIDEINNRYDNLLNKLSEKPASQNLQPTSDSKMEIIKTNFLTLGITEGNDFANNELQKLNYSDSQIRDTIRQWNDEKNQTNYDKIYSEPLTKLKNKTAILEHAKKMGVSNGREIDDNKFYNISFDMNNLGAGNKRLGDAKNDQLKSTAGKVFAEVLQKYPDYEAGVFGADEFIIYDKTKNEPIPDEIAKKIIKEINEKYNNEIFGFTDNFGNKIIVFSPSFSHSKGSNLKSISDIEAQDYKKKLSEDERYWHIINLENGKVYRILGRGETEKGIEKEIIKANPKLYDKIINALNKALKDKTLSENQKQKLEKSLEIWYNKEKRSDLDVSQFLRYDISRGTHTPISESNMEGQGIQQQRGMGSVSGGEVFRNAQPAATGEITESEKNDTQSQSNIKLSLSKTPINNKVDFNRLQNSINQIKQNWKNSPQIIALQTANELPENIKLLAIDNLENVEGAFDTDNDTIYLVAENLLSLTRAQEVLFHETIGHYGLEKMLGDEFDKILTLIYRNIGADGLRKIAEEYSLDLSNAEDLKLALKEYLARFSEKVTDMSLLDKIISKIREFLRKIFPYLKFSFIEIKNLIKKSRDFVEGKNEIKNKLLNVNPENKNIKFSLKPTSDTSAESDLSVYAKEQLTKENQDLLEAEFKAGTRVGFSNAWKNVWKIAKRTYSEKINNLEENIETEYQRGVQKGFEKKTVRKDKLITQLKTNLESEFQRGLVTGWDKMNKKAIQRYEYYREKIEEMKDKNLKKIFIQQILIDYAKAKLPVRLRGPLLGWIRNTATELNLEKAKAHIDNIAEEDNKKQLIINFKKFFDKFDFKNEVVTYTDYSGETFTNAKYLKDVQKILEKLDFNKPTDETIGSLQNLKEEWIRQQQKQQSEIQDIVEARQSAHPHSELYKKGLLWNIVKDIERLEKTPVKDMSYFDLKNLFDLVKNTYHLAKMSGLFILDEKKVEFEAKLYEITAEVLEGAEIEEGVKNSLNTEKAHYPIKSKLKEILKKLKETKKIDTADLKELWKNIPKVSEFRKEFHYKSLSPETLVKMIGPKAHDFFFKQWNKGYTEMLTYRQKSLDSFKNYLEENDIDLNKWYEIIDIENDIKLSKNERLWFYVNSKNMKNITHIIGREFDGNSGGIMINGKKFFITPEQFNTILNSITEEERKLGDFIFDFFDAQYEKMNEMFVKENGYEMPRAMFYFPIEVEGSELAQSSQQEKMFDEITQNYELFRASLNKGFTEQRTGAANAVTGDIWGQVYRNINTASNYIGYALAVRNINRMIYDPKKVFKTAIIAKFGIEYWNALAMHNKNIASEYKVFNNFDKAIGWFRKNYTTAILALPNFLTPIKNYLALFNAMARMDAFEVAKAFYNVQFYTPLLISMDYIKKIAVDPKYIKNFIEDVKNGESEYKAIEKKWSELSPIIRERMNMGFNKETKQIMLSKGAVQQIYNTKNIREILMSGIQYTDKKTTLAVAEAAFNIKMKELQKDNISDIDKIKAAVEYAEQMVRSTQPMSDALFLSLYQQGNAWEKLFTMFTSDSNRI